MPEENKPIETEQPVTAPGKVQFMTGAAFSNPPPALLKRILAALKYFCVSLITMVSATDIFSGGQAKVINFSLGAFILFLGFIEIATGVKPIEDEKR